MAAVRVTRLLFLYSVILCNVHAAVLTQRQPDIARYNLNHAADGSVGSGRKRGVGWGLNATLMHELAGMDWWYDWGPGAGDAQTMRAAAKLGMHFAPMQWGRWGIEQLEANIQAGSSVLLGMNEPNHHLQANLTPQEAAALWSDLERAADRLGLRLGAPAAAPCGAQCVVADPFAWWDAFFASCPGCRVDFLATHYYSCSMGGLAAYLQRCRKYRLPIWLTEFACPNPGGPDVVSLRFMAQALELLDREGWVEKYAWYSLETDGWLGTSNSLMDMQTGQLTDLGRLYLSHMPASDSNSMIDALAVEPWDALCQPCIEHVGSGRPLRELQNEEQQHCSIGCGFWEAASKPEQLQRDTAPDIVTEFIQEI